MKDLRLKRHETFSIREGWLEKGLNTIVEDNECFRKDNGPRMLGLGSNMCKSLKYWLKATGIADFGQVAELTEFGNLLYEYDKFLESNFSWFMIHAKLTMGIKDALEDKDAPVINRIFNGNYSKFDKELLVNYLTEYFKVNGYDICAESSLDSDVSIAIRSYTSNDISNPENNMNCPLGKLNLIKIDDKKRYYKNQPSHSALHYLVVYYVMIECMNRAEDFNLDDFCNKENNPMKIFNITKPMLLLYLEEMQNAGILKIIKTAGLNTIHINKMLSLEELFGLYF